MLPKFGGGSNAGCDESTETALRRGVGGAVGGAASLLDEEDVVALEEEIANLDARPHFGAVA